MLLRSLPVYILKQLFFSISVNSGRIFTSPLRSSVNILPLFIYYYYYYIIIIVIILLLLLLLAEQEINSLFALNQGKTNLYICQTADSNQADETITNIRPSYVTRTKTGAPSGYVRYSVRYSKLRFFLKNIFSALKSRKISQGRIGLSAQ